MRDFEYLAPPSVAEAVRALAQHNGSARALAGGTDLIDQIRTGRQQPQVVVDIKKIPELNVLELSAKGLRLGAAVPCYRIYDDEGITKSYAALADSARIIGGIQIQSRASVGGNLCNSGPAADSTPSLIALGAVAVIAGPQGRPSLAKFRLKNTRLWQLSRHGNTTSFKPSPSMSAIKMFAALGVLRSGSHLKRSLPSL